MSDKGKRPTIGVLAGWQAYQGMLPHKFLEPLFIGICAAARDADCNVLLACGVDPFTASHDLRPAWPIVSPDSDYAPVGPWNTDGLIVVAPLLSETRSRDVNRFINAGHPVIFVGAGEGTPAVVPDNEGGVLEAVAHLAGHGHKRIAFLAGYGEDLGDGGRRLLAYRMGVQEHQLDADRQLIVFGLHNDATGQQAVQRLLALGVSFTAVLASNDESAIGAMRALEAAGKRVPEDVAVIGFDDRVEAIAQRPQLTTVRYPVFAAGYTALELLLRQVAGFKDSKEITRIPARLIIRQSCGCSSSSTSFSSVADRRERTSLFHLLLPRKLDSSAAPILQQVEREMVDIVLGGVRKLSEEQVRAMCQQWLQAFLASLKGNDALSLRQAVAETAHQIEERNDDLHIWQGVISVLEARWPLLVSSRFVLRRWRMVEEMLHQARIAISEGVQRQHVLQLVQQSALDDQFGLMTARFLAVLNEENILHVLIDALPGLGVYNTRVVFLEPDGDDPVAWGIVQTDPTSPGDPVRFPSRSFPPPGMYSDERPFSLALLPLVIQEHVSGFVVFETASMGSGAAIVRQLAAALRSAQLYQGANRARLIAEEASQLKSGFLSTVSHELRTPLNLVVGLSEMLLREEGDGEFVLPERCRHDLERVHASAQHLDGLIRDVLDLARSEAGRLQLTCGMLDLGDMMQSVSAVGEQMVLAKGLRWSAQIPKDLPQMWGDRTRLQQVVLNLISNAVKFTTSGEVELRVVADEKNLMVSVRDTGLGISLEEQKMIFDEFRRSERASGRGYGGMGLGLAICRRLVELHGGEIRVESLGVDGSGSMFSFTLPLAKAPADDSASAS